MACACSSTYLGAWGGKTAWAQEFEAAVSYDHTTPGWETEQDPDSKRREEEEEEEEKRSEAKRSEKPIALVMLFPQNTESITSQTVNTWG